MHASTSPFRRFGTAIALATTLALVGTAAGCGSDDDTTGTTKASAETSAEAVTVSDAWVKAVPSGMTGAFGVLENAGDEDAQVESVTTDLSGMVELHETVSDGAGGMKMQPKEGGFTIPAGGSHELAPGGDHIMLMKVTRAITPGEDVELTLHFADGSTETVTALVKDFKGAEEKYDSDGTMSGGHDMESGSDG